MLWKVKFDEIEFLAKSKGSQGSMLVKSHEVHILISDYNVTDNGKVIG